MLDFFVNICMIIWVIDLFCPVPHWFVISSIAIPFMIIIFTNIGSKD